jgi:hypothetical protein
MVSFFDLAPEENDQLVADVHSTISGACSTVH